METTKNSFQKMALLTGAKVLGIFFSMAIPMYLGRKLSIETYGTYKQIMLFFWFAQVGLNFGLDDSVYYYLRQDTKNFSLYSVNAFAFNFAATSLLWAFIIIFKFEIAHLLKNPALVQYLPLLGFLILGTVCSAQYGGILIGLNRFKERLALEVGLEFLKSLAIISAFYFFDSIYMVLVFLSTIMGIQLLMTLAIIHRYRKAEGLKIEQAIPHFLKQLKFGLPLGISRIFQNLLNMENFLISSLLGMAQFTFYSVGSFENPIVNSSRSSLFELANIEMADSYGKKEKIYAAWLRMIRKLFLILVPFLVYMIFFARELIVFIFSSKYLASVPIFMLFNVYIFIVSLNPEPLFRATTQTKIALKIRTLGSIAGMGLIVAGALLGGTLGALTGKIIAVALINFTGLWMGSKMIDVKFSQLLIPEELSKIFVSSVILSFSLKWISSHFVMNEFFILAVTFSLYSFALLFTAIKLDLIREDEVRSLKNFIHTKVFKKLQFAR